ncbi:hypothetical protein NPIL_597731 [Nephila pilipes]|uniref:Uncharacterized protein n=1 Tax=Nephila pilipes TaxID=299642 RepID=A0A8X6IN61_NEPPI|nr:hypothetical protein NPIL_597731 [Nephila pilipes]
MRCHFCRLMTTVDDLNASAKLAQTYALEENCRPPKLHLKTDLINGAMQRGKTEVRRARSLNQTTLEINATIPRSLVKDPTLPFQPVTNPSVFQNVNQLA